MSDGLLSQEEIDALLRGEPTTSPSSPELSAIEKDALGEIGNISMGSAATTLSILLGRRVSITTPRLSMATITQIRQEYPLPYIIIEVKYTYGLDGSNLLAMREQDALIIADLMMGGDGTNPPAELSELHLSAVSEAMNQMMGSTATSMSTMFKKKIDIAPPQVSRIDFAVDPTIASLGSQDEPLVRVAFKMEVENLIDSEIMQLVTFDVAKELAENLLGAVQPQPVSSLATQAAPPQPAAATLAQPVAAPHRNPAATPMSASSPKPNMNVAVQPVQFAPLKPATLPLGDPNINLIMDVPLQVTVELGRTRKLIRDILELGPGSVVELDKLAGEPVDILVNGKLIAKGEVVVIDENFGVRVTEIISPIERASHLQ